MFFQIIEKVRVPFNVLSKKFELITHEMRLAETKLIKFLAEETEFSLYNLRIRNTITTKIRHKFKFFEKFNNPMNKLFPSSLQNYLDKNSNITDAWEIFKKQNIGKHSAFPNLLLQYWGIYEIYNSYHDRYYIGLSTELIKRLIYHSTGLLKNTEYKCKELQNDVKEIINKKLDPRKFVEITLLYCQFKMNKNLTTEDTEIKELNDLETDVLSYYKKKGYYLYNSKF